MIALERIHELFTIDLEAGRLFWKKTARCGNTKLIGREAGNPGPLRFGKRYWVIVVDGKQYKRSRIMLCAATGIWPTFEVDHINGDSLNDRRANLREASHIENCWNRQRRQKSSPLPMGIRLTSSGSYQARICCEGKPICLGSFTSLERAVYAYTEKRRELFGEFSGMEEKCA